jgi:hypothetical protein
VILCLWQTRVGTEEGLWPLRLQPVGSCPMVRCMGCSNANIFAAVVNHAMWMPLVASALWSHPHFRLSLEKLLLLTTEGVLWRAPKPRDMSSFFSE